MSPLVTRLRAPLTSSPLTPPLLALSALLAWGSLTFEASAQAPTAEAPIAQELTQELTQEPTQESDAERRAAEEASRRVNRLSDQLKSPFCPGKTLLTCTSYQAFKLRKEMTQMIAEGKSDPEILAALRDSFGDDIENPIQPWYTAIVPILPFVCGALIALWMFSMWLRGSQRKASEGEQVAEPEVDEAQRERLKALLRDDL